MKALINCFILAIFLLSISCDTPLTEYNPKNEDEKQIVDLLQKYADARNNEDVIGIQSLFHDNGIYLSGAGPKYTKSEIATTDPMWWSEMGEYRITDPDIKINGNEALVSMNSWYGKGRFQAAVTLVKEDGNWLVMKLSQ